MAQEPEITLNKYKYKINKGIDPSRLDDSGDELIYYVCFLFFVIVHPDGVTFFLKLYSLCLFIVCSQ